MSCRERSAALEQLSVIDSIKKAAGTIHLSAVTIEGNCTEVTSAIQRLLDEALSALSGLGDVTANEVPAATYVHPAPSTSPEEHARSSSQLTTPADLGRCD